MPNGTRTSHGATRRYGSPASRAPWYLPVTKSEKKSSRIRPAENDENDWSETLPRVWNEYGVLNGLPNATSCVHKTMPAMTENEDTAMINIIRFLRRS